MQKKKPKKRKQNKKDPRDELPLRRTISLYKYDKLLKAIFDRIKADDRYTARLVKSYESLSKNFDDQTKWQDALVNDIILKHKRIKTQDKVQKATIKEVGPLVKAVTDALSKTEDDIEVRVLFLWQPASGTSFQARCALMFACAGGSRAARGREIEVRPRGKLAQAA